MLFNLMRKNFVLFLALAIFASCGKVEKTTDNIEKSNNSLDSANTNMNTLQKNMVNVEDVMQKLEEPLSKLVESTNNLNLKLSSFDGDMKELNTYLKDMNSFMKELNTLTQDPKLKDLKSKILDENGALDEALDFFKKVNNCFITVYKPEYANPQMAPEKIKELNLESAKIYKSPFDNKQEYFIVAANKVEVTDVKNTELITMPGSFCEQISQTVRTQADRGVNEVMKLSKELLDATFGDSADQEAAAKKKLEAELVKCEKWKIETNGKKRSFIKKFFSSKKSNQEHEDMMKLCSEVEKSKIKIPSMTQTEKDLYNNSFETMKLAWNEYYHTWDVAKSTKEQFTVEARQKIKIPRITIERIREDYNHGNDNDRTKVAELVESLKGLNGVGAKFVFKSHGRAVQGDALKANLAKHLIPKLNAKLDPNLQFNLQLVTNDEFEILEQIFDVIYEDNTTPEANVELRTFLVDTFFVLYERQVYRNNAPTVSNVEKSSPLETEKKK